MRGRLARPAAAPLTAPAPLPAPLPSLPSREAAGVDKLNSGTLPLRIKMGLKGTDLRSVEATQDKKQRFRGRKRDGLHRFGRLVSMQFTYRIPSNWVG